ncbi:helix-turn-helix domain-containing protein [Lacihabitans soyangensis]|uniref:AraC family transcriptional regulator n=1 Tax=Lacihabitans soyangensis TaxID=869394 RepID=A0AAE3H7E8_9BACT|nr:helix-turn-helix transcriptional regulator [Lacihabitans soyangensis]MCP9765545.1 AraC family transcriptional regulator [Lacihabitans soyangensis]
MKKSIGGEAIPIIDTTQLESELLFQAGIPVSSLTANAHTYFHINRVEDYFRMIDFPLPSDLQPRRMTVYNFFFLTKGLSSRSSGLDTYEFGENTFFFVPAHQITTHKFIRKDVEGFYCHFDIELLTDKTNLRNLLNEFPFLEFNSFPLVKIDTLTKGYVLPLLERLLIEYKSDKKNSFDIFRSYLIALFSELKPFVETSTPVSANAASLITEQFKKALSKYIYEKNKITDYAELLSISPNHLNKCVKNTLGKSAHDLLNEMLLLEAKVLLKQTNLNVTEIAYKIGKNEVTDFARFFKTQTGMRPSEYRSNN